MSRVFVSVFVFTMLISQLSFVAPTARGEKRGLKVGVAAVRITPFGANPDWDGTITESGVWGEKFTDSNHNGHWDRGEPFDHRDRRKRFARGD